MQLVSLLISDRFLNEQQKMAGKVFVVWQTLMNKIDTGFSFKANPESPCFRILLKNLGVFVPDSMTSVSLQLQDSFTLF
jgi:hypothetical protein